MKRAVLISTGEPCFVLSQATEGSPYHEVLMPFKTVSKAGKLGHIQNVRKDKVKIVRGTIGLEVQENLEGAVQTSQAK